MLPFALARPERAMLQSDIAALPWAHVTLLFDKLGGGELGYDHMVTTKCPQSEGRA
jgi:hypothetical protein